MSDGINQSPLKTERESAKYLRISQRNLWALRKNKKIAATFIGRKVFYTIANLDRFIAENSGPTGANG